MTYKIDTALAQGFTKPSVRLVGEDGNAFSIIARVRTALTHAGRRDLAEEYTERAMSGEYDQLLALVSDYCEVE